MTPAGELLRQEILRRGPIPFHRFMEVALYHPEHGYYRRGRDPFGKDGDFYTAEQLQPVFGMLIAAVVRQLYEEMGGPTDFTVVELGAGRGEMAAAFAEWRYVPVEVNSGELPARFNGVVFANEFFDALPVDVMVRHGHALQEKRVGWNGERFHWVGTEPGEEAQTLEVNPGAAHWLARIGERLERGYLLAIDYGYTEREMRRFPEGTLMSYRRHVASEDVLADPGERDITAHIDFTALERHARRAGLETVRLETLAQLLLRAGERDQFAAALSSTDETRARLALKTLLFGMGETFRALLLRKVTAPPG